MRKVIEITEKKLGRPPLEYCWVVFGSEGRREQTFKTDQDNAIIYADPESPGKSEAARTYFSALTLLVRDSLQKCGFALCPADYMASNSQWCQPLSVWKRYFSGWINEPRADAVLKSLIFFDFRPVHGHAELAEALRSALVGMLENQTLFLGFMANTIIKNSPPIGFLKSFVVEKSGEHKDEFDLKIKGLAPLVDAVRLFALEKGIRETSTLERINALKESHAIVRESGEELEYAFEFIMLLRIQHQFDQIDLGRQPDNFINPYKLSNLEKKIIKDAFFLIAKIQDLIIERYKVSIW
jgi:CBS domain-containing protein